jgi:hypothetical protein
MYQLTIYEPRPSSGARMAHGGLVLLQAEEKIRNI